MSNIIVVDHFKVNLDDLKFLSRQRIEAMDDPHSYVPEHTRDGIIRWIEWGITPGSFLEAVITNDLKNTFGRADHINIEHVRSILAWFYNFAPSECWGSEECCQQWQLQRQHDLQQLRAKEA